MYDIFKILKLDLGKLLDISSSQIIFPHIQQHNEDHWNRNDNRLLGRITQEELKKKVHGRRILPICARVISL